MTRVAHKTDGIALDKAVDYVYDAWNRRIERRPDADGDGAADRSEYYVWDAADVVLDFVDADGDSTAASPELSRRYLYGAAVDEVLADEEFDATAPSTPGTVRWPLADNLGSVRDVLADPESDGTYAVSTHVVYDSFGNATATAGSLSDIRFLYTGQEYDADAGLYYYNARWYDAAAGRFLSEDPIGFAADENLYRYVGNGPTNATDPSGLQTVNSILDKAIKGGKIAKEALDDYKLLTPSNRLTPQQREAQWKLRDWKKVNDLGVKAVLRKWVEGEFVLRQ